MDIVSSQSWNVPYREPSCLLWETLVCEMLWFVRSIYPNLPQMGQKIYHGIMRRVLDLLEFKNQESQCFAGNQWFPGVWHDMLMPVDSRQKKNFGSNKRQWISFRPQRWDVPYRKPSCLLWEAPICEKHIPKPAPNGTKFVPRHVDAAPW